LLSFYAPMFYTKLNVCNY